MSTSLQNLSYRVAQQNAYTPSQFFQSAKNAVRSLPKLYWWLVIWPSIIAALYYVVIASDRFVVTASVVVEQDNLSAAPSVDLGLLSLGSSSEQNDALIVKAFMESQAMMAEVDKSLDLRSHFRLPVVDFINRLSRSASKEDFYEHYLKHIEATVDSESSIIELKVSAYTAEFAKQLADTMVAFAENFVNNVSQGLAEQQLGFVQAEVDKNSQRLSRATKDLVDLQRQYEIVSPEVEAQTLGEIIAGLQAELAQEKAVLKTKLSYLTKTAPEVVASRKRIAALEQQIEQERATQTGGNETSVNNLYLKYQGAQLNVTVATEVYQASLASLEAARLDASRKVKYLVAVSSAQLPEEPKEPRRLYSLVTAFMLLNLLYLIAVLVIATINDHRE